MLAIAGKTFTMEGDLTDLTCHSNAGVAPRIVHALFQALRAGGGEYTVRISHMELYNEVITDLLTASENPKPLRIFETPETKGQAAVFGMEDVLVQTAFETIKAMQDSQSRKFAAEAKQNRNSRYRTLFFISKNKKRNVFDRSKTFAFFFSPMSV